MAHLKAELLKGVAHIPSDLKDSYSLLSELDSAVVVLVAQVEEWYTQIRKTRKPPSRALRSQLQAAHQLLLDIADEKIALADQSYDVLDNQIRKLDEQLHVVGDVLRRNGQDPVLTPAHKTAAGRRSPSAGSGAAEAPIDPHEPVYCKCRQVAFGLMIACDNALCPIEWFHYQCVGLAERPPSKWLCPTCSAAASST